MRNLTGRLLIVLAAMLLAACAEYATADWPDLREGFEYSPSAPDATRPPPTAPTVPPVTLEPAEVARLLAESGARFDATKGEIAALLAQYEAALADFESQSGEAAGRAWLSLQLALSRVSQAADELSLLIIDLRRAETRAGDQSDEVRALMSAVEDHKAATDGRLVGERDRLEARRPG